MVVRVDRVRPAGLGVRSSRHHKPPADFLEGSNAQNSSDFAGLVSFPFECLKVTLQRQIVDHRMLDPSDTIDLEACSIAISNIVIVVEESLMGIGVEVRNTTDSKFAGRPFIYNLEIFDNMF